MINCISQISLFSSIKDGLEEAKLQPVTLVKRMHTRKIQGKNNDSLNKGSNTISCNRNEVNRIIGGRLKRIWAADCLSELWKEQSLQVNKSQIFFLMA